MFVHVEAPIGAPTLQTLERVEECNQLAASHALAIVGSILAFHLLVCIVDDVHKVLPSTSIQAEANDVERRMEEHWSK